MSFALSSLQHLSNGMYGKKSSREEGERGPARMSQVPDHDGLGSKEKTAADRKGQNKPT